MTAVRDNHNVRRSALGWLRRLGWEYVAPGHGDPVGADGLAGIRQQRLLQRLQAIRFAAQGQDWPLSADSIARIIADLTPAPLRQGLLAGNHAWQRQLVDGIDTLQTLPDGQVVPVTVALIDWAQVQANCWEIAEASAVDTGTGAQPTASGLVGYVNGLPLVRVSCAERDRHRRWADLASAVEHHLHGQQSATLAPLYARAQLLLALDRRGGCYGLPGTPAEDWLRWHEPDCAGAALQRLRQAPCGGDPADLRGVHAPLLAGVLAPARALQLLRGFVHCGGDGQRRIASAAQFLAVQAGLAQLRRVDANGRRQGGQLCLAAGSGAGQVRGWLLQALRRETALRHCRVLVVGAPLAGAAPAKGNRARAPAQQLATFMGAGQERELTVSAATLHGWLRRREGGHAGDDLIVLLDATFWSGDAARLRRARRQLPRAGWLTIAEAPVACAHEGDDRVLFASPVAAAVAEGSIIPVLYAARCEPATTATHSAAGNAASPAATTTRHIGVAETIGLHFGDSIAQAERDLGALLLVDGMAQARHYLRAFEQAGLLHCALAADLPAEALRQEAELLIVPGPEHRLPRDRRRAVLYIDCALPRAALLRWMAAINLPHPGKRCALMVDLRTPPALADASAFDGWGPQPLQHGHAQLPRQHRRLRALLPHAASDDFHACRDHLGPRWVLDTQGRDSDAHRRRRRLLHARVTGFGQQLETALCAAHTEAAHYLPAERGLRYRHDLHFCSLLRDAVNADAQDADGYRAEDVRIRHWARAQAPELHEPLLEDYQVLRTLDAPSPRRDADALHSRLRRRLERAFGADRAAWQRWDRQLRALLAGPLAAAERLAGLCALQDRIEADAAADLPPALPPRPLVQACYGVLCRQLGEPAPAQQDGRIALAVQLEAAVAATHASLPAAPHLFTVGLRRRLAAVLAAELDPTMAGTVLEALLELAPCGWQVA